MAQIAKSKASLRFFGDDLNPDEISKCLGCEPTAAQIKGQEVALPDGKMARVAPTGMWRLDAADSEPEALDDQVAGILGNLSDELEVWADLSSRFDMNLFVGLFLNETNEGCEISSKVLRTLGDRGIELWLDIYSCDH